MPSGQSAPYRFGACRGALARRRRHNGAHQNGMSKIGAGRVTAGGQRRLTSGTKPRRGFWHWPACRMVYAAAPAGCHGGIWHGKSGRDRVWYHTWAKVWRMLALGIARLTGRRTASAPGQGPRRLHIAAQQNGVVAAPLRRICGGTSHCIRGPKRPHRHVTKFRGLLKNRFGGGGALDTLRMPAGVAPRCHSRTPRSHIKSP